MWISRQVKDSNNMQTLETGCATVNRNGEIEAVSSGVERSVNIFSPFGYSYSLPSGERMLMAGNVSMGVKMDSSVNEGEIKISNPYGAYIYLKNDGSVEINGLVISKSGEVINDD